MPKPWLKMWGEWIHDPKMLVLSWDERGMWWGLVTLAQQCEADGRLVKGDGTPLNRQDIAMCLHISKRADLRTLNSMLDKMQKADSLSWNDDTLFIIHFSERQARQASATKEAIRERVRRHRQQQIVTEKPLQSTDIQETKMALSLANELRLQLSKLPSFTNKQLEHEVIREALINVAQLKGYITNQEVTTPSGRIDLTWTDKMGNPAAAFEIDDELPKEKSLENLKSTVYPLRVIILRSSSRPPSYIDGILILGLQIDVTEKSLHPLTIPTTTKEGDIEVEVEVEKTLLQHSVTPVTPEAVLAEISQLYEKNFGIITPILAENFKDFAENYRGPLEWIHDAFEEACSQNVRKWVYVEKILETCQAEGRKPHGKREQQRKEERGKPAARRRGDREYTAEERRRSLE